MHGTLSFILGGGRGAGLYPLTSMRSAPAVSVAGKYRVIDIPLSNCINSGLRRIYVLTQFLSVSLHRHIANTYGFAPFSQGYVQVLAAQQTNDTADWYQGTADALRQNLRYLAGDKGRDILILSGDGLYRMDYADLVKRHRHSGADLTIAAVRVHADRASSYGLLRTDGSEKKELADVLTRPYPERVAGKLLSYGFDASTQTATMSWESDPSVEAPTEISVPARVFPRGVTVECGGCMVEEAPGIVRLRTPPPGNPTTVTLRPR